MSSTSMKSSTTKDELVEGLKTWKSCEPMGPTMAGMGCSHRALYIRKCRALSEGSSVVWLRYHFNGVSGEHQRCGRWILAASFFAGDVSAGAQEAAASSTR